MITKLRYEDLPSPLAIVVGKEDFLRAQARLEARTIIIWVRDKQLRRQRECEFDLLLGRLLSTSERFGKMPPPCETYSKDAAWKVRISYLLEEGSNVCYEMYAISSADRTSEIIEARQIYFAPVKIEVDEIVAQALKKAKFPKLYMGWSNEEKIQYWALALYRLRRSNSESGFSQDLVFDKKLIANMRRLDHKIEKILPDIIAHLARMEQIEISLLFGTFRRRTGRKLVLKT